MAITEQFDQSAQIGRLIDRAWNSRASTLSTLAKVGQEDMERKAMWRDRESNIRFLLIRLSDHDYAIRLNIRLALASANWQPTETQLLLAEGSTARGETLSILADLTDELLDQNPDADEWSVREAIAHIVAIEQRYAAWVDFSARRYRDGKDPAEIPPSSGPTRIAIEGDVATIRGELVNGREKVNRAFSSLPDDLLVASTTWSDWDVDLRFRLHRYSAHEREHANQIRKSLQAVGHQSNEVGMLLGQAEIARAAMLAELIGVPDELLYAAGPSGTALKDSLISASSDEVALVARIADTLSSEA